MKKIISIIMVVMVVFLIGGCSKMTGTPSKEEMTKVVKSEEGKKIIEEGLKNMEKDALTEKGVIKSYEVDYDSVKHNPMGGIMFDIYINNDKELYIRKTLVRGIDGKLTSGGGGYSSKLDRLLERLNNE
ncbi:MAG: DUF1310 family protein [Gemella morbillorum]|uniref:DUF1310 family protein n=1 Tax=Gemella morbillorum TaxID=29391 RepID=UPI001CAF5225|nr:DUF1310 family protein [Gemella morbillorum]MBF1209666.1 DUF1310 family protein [Gemella morbillorum]